MPFHIFFLGEPRFGVKATIGASESDPTVEFAFGLVGAPYELPMEFAFGLVGAS